MREMSKDVSDEEFAATIDPFRRELQAHCYRMLGNVHEAEDLAQDALIRAWQRRETFEGRGSLRAWLYKIATNACLNALARKPRRTLPLANGAAAQIDAPIPPAQREPIWLEPFPDAWLAEDSDQSVNPEAHIAAHESITLAFMTVLHQLPPRQRAILLLCDVLDWPVNEVAGLLETTRSAAKSALHRARATLTQRYRRVSDDSINLADDALRDKLARYVRAWEGADVEGLVALLKSDATFSMPPIPVWYCGREAIRWLTGRTVFAGAPARRWRLLPTRASGCLAFGLYKLDESDDQFHAYGIQVVSFGDGQIADITTCINPTLAASFGLPSIV
jgi:RNA polymerase sigma-70 factor (ECF subfamily)